MYAKHQFSTSLKNRIIIRKAKSERDIDAAYSMGKQWLKDYIKAGDFATGSGSKAEIHMSALLGNQIVVIIDKRYAGYAELGQKNGNKVINVVYVDKRFRRKGVARALYLYLMNECGAKEIELTFQRVIERVDYWKSLGFKSVKDLGEGYTLRDICRLSICESEQLLFSTPLSESKIAKLLVNKGTDVPIKNNILDYYKFTNF